jgi:diguanylate cyclase (GGDEF)-like protein/hemerythrin-like metal-binding protein/PAS domain S-box-containing protein
MSMNKHRFITFTIIAITCIMATLLIRFNTQQEKDEIVRVDIDSSNVENKVLLSEKEKNYLQGLGKVRMCVDPEWEPYEKISEKDEHEGIAADLISIIAARTGITLELVATKDWNESISVSKKKDCDILSFLNKTAERDKWLLFTEPYFTDPNVLVTREEHSYIADLSSLTDEVVVLPKGTSIEERVRQDYPNLKIVLVETEAQAIQLVSQRKANMTIRSLTMAAYVIRKEGLFNLKIAGQIPNYLNNLRIGVDKEKPLLRDILNKGISTLTPKEVQEIINRHVSINVQGTVNYKLIAMIAGIFFVVFFIGILWNYQLRRLNGKLAIRQQELTELSVQLKDDVARREKIELELKESEELYRSILYASPNAIVIMDENGRIIMTSPRTSSIFASSIDYKFVGGNITQFISPEDREKAILNIKSIFMGKSMETKEYQGMRSDGSAFIMEVNSEIIRDTNGNPKQMVSIIRDITNRRRTEEYLNESEEKYRLLSKELERKNKILSNSIIIDKLTGINNRHYFDKRVSEEIEVSDRYKTPLSMIFFDLDKFKNVNDTFGHDVGDDVLIAITDNVRRFIRKTDVFARWGGEEFVILMTQTGTQGAAAVAEKIRHSVEQIVHPEAGQVTISLGVAERKSDEYLESWFKRADQSLYIAKREGRNQICVSKIDGAAADVQVHLQWQASWECGNNLMDEQHRSLLNMGNDLVESSLNGSEFEVLNQKLDKLINHILKHFQDEENLLAQVEFPDFEKHVYEHKDLVDKALKLKAKFREDEIKPSEAFEFIVNDIITEHLLKEDIQYYPYLGK